MINRENLSKSIVAENKLKNEIFSEINLEIKSPGRGLSPLEFNKLIGKKAKRFFNKGDFLYISDLKNK